MEFRDLLIKGCRKTFRLLFHPAFFPKDYELDRNLANSYIFNLLTNESPCMISRFGTVEIGIVNNYLSVNSDESLIRRCYHYVTDETALPWWDKLFFKTMCNNAGVFPETIDVLNQFSKRYLKDIPEIDLLGSFNYTEKFMPLRHDCRKVHIECLYPFWVENPWTLALKDKKILIIHPFIHSIKSQYEKRDKLFKNPNILPDCELILLRAVQSNAGNKVPYKDWFEALAAMEEKISETNFDICILGCGAYGLPLAAFVKRLGKKAVHLGGGSQLLFGIKGSRWEKDYKYDWLPENFNTNYTLLFNKYWTRPSQEETPIAANKVEDACYW